MKGQIASRSQGCVIAATDASVLRRDRRVGIGYLSTSGHWGALRYTAMSRRSAAHWYDSSEAELLAVAFLFQSCRPDVLLLDSMDAIRYLRAWHSGDTAKVPSAYEACFEPGDRMTLQELARRVSQSPGMEIRHVRGHSGHLLNEAADSLAKMASHSRLEPGKPDDLCRQFLASWQQQECVA